MVGLVPGSWKDEALETQSELKIDSGRTELTAACIGNGLRVTHGTCRTAASWFLAPPP